ncbi:MAG: phosphoglucomutase/phosphomannomutase family protein [Dehalococcoidia bacterium]|nr:phosphoglucomutase/phosphomannomutase family protein [Dehalococcoidia bacterium]
MTGNAIKFGTDGWRAVIANDFTFDNVHRCVQAIADYLKACGLADREQIIGYDTRFASADFARAAAEVLAGNHIRAVLSDRAVPTPVISWGIANMGAGGGIVVTASHNPATWNGLKYKSPDGASAPVGTVAEIEHRAAETSSEDVKCLDISTAISQDLVRFADLRPSYAVQVGRLVDLEAIKRAGFTVMVDPMHGAGAGYYPQLLDGGQSRILEIRAEPNPSFPGMRQPEPIAPNLTRLASAVKESGASVGIANDGDADRLGLMDEHGNFLNQLQVYALLTLYLLEVRAQRGAIVRTITSSGMLDKLGQLYDVPVFEVPVGFKYVAPVMQRENAMVGGEESGGYGYRGHVPERDGILSGLLFLDFMARTGKTPSELLAYLYTKVGPHHYDRRDVVFAAIERAVIVARLEKASPISLANVSVVRKDTLDGFRFILADGSWLLIRFSGTEPLLRIYSESQSPDTVDTLLTEGVRLAGV